MPLCDQPVRRKPAMQVTAGGSVLVVNKAAHNRAELLDVEEGVLELQRIECPLNHLDVRGEGKLTLYKLHPASQSRIPIRTKYAKHVTVEIAAPPGLHSRDTKAERNQPVLI